MLVWADRVAELSATTGTGSFALSGAPTSFVTFASVCAVDDVVYYLAVALDGSGAPSGDWEVGLGTYVGSNTLARTRILASSNAGAAVSFAAGTKRVVLTQTATSIRGHSTPVAADFSTQRNGTGMGAATIADLTVSPGVVMSFSRNSVGSDWKQSYLLKAAPGAPFRAEALITMPWQTTNDFLMFGLAISSTNGADVAKHVQVGNLLNSSTWLYPYSKKNNGLNAQGADLTTLNAPTRLGQYVEQIWCAIEWDGTNINTYASFDGYAWWKHGVEPDTFFTGDPGLVGFGWEAVLSDGGTQYAWCSHFYVTTNLNEPLGRNRIG